MAITKDFIVKNGLQVLGVGSGASTSTITGAVVVTGGVGVSGALNVGGVTKLTSGTAATDKTSGALQVTGGVGVSGTIYANDMYSNGAQVITTATLDVFSGIVQTITAGTDTAVSGTTGDVTVWNTSNLQSVTNRGATTDKAISVTNSSAASDTTSGALTVAGGVGVGGSLYATTVYSNGKQAITGVVPTAGTAISVTSVTTSSGQVSFTINNTGVTSLTTSGNGISVDTTTGGITISNTGVTSNAAGNGISLDNTSGAVTITNTGVLGVVGGTDITLSTTSGVTTISDASTLQTVSGRGATTNVALQITNTTQSTTSTDGALTVSGGVGITKNLTVGGNLNVWGPTTFAETVTFNGTATFVNSTNTVYTDNIIELHTPPGGIGSTWGSTDGKDIGFRFHYFNTANSTDTNAALVLAHDSQLLEFYSAGAEDVGGVFSGTTYGGFKTGSVYAANTGNATTSTFGSSGGALQVAGGASVKKDLWVGGNLYSGGSQVATIDSLGGSGVGAIYAGNGISVDQNTGAVTVTNTGVLGVVGGTDITLSTTSGVTTISDASTLQTVSGRGATTNNAISITNATASNDTSSGALIVAGGVGVGKDLRATRVFDAGNRVITSVTVSAGTGLSGGGTITGDTGTVTLTNTGLLSITAGTDTAVSVTAGAVTVWDTATLQSVTGRGATTNNAVEITNATSATSTTTGALKVTGGVGVQGDVYARNLYADGIKVATINDLAADGVNKIVAGNGISINTSTGDVTVSNTGVLGVVGGTDITLSTTSGVTTISDASTLQTVTGRGATTNNAVSITNGTASTDSTSGALVVTGGAAVGGNLNVGGAVGIGAAAQASSFASATTSTNATMSLDSFSTTAFRTAKYVVQVFDTDTNGVQAEELLVFHDGTSAYIVRYAVGSSAGEMGDWDANKVGSTITLTFTPNYIPSGSVLTVKTMRTLITA